MVDGKQVAAGMRVIAYPHFPTQVVFPRPAALLVRADIRILAKRVGYVMGAGDEIPDALRRLGCDVTLLGAEDLAAGDLGRFDAIAIGVRAYNVRADLRASRRRLLDYVSNGGTLVVQYNVLDYGASADAPSKIGPYPIKISRERVTVEEAPVTFTDPRAAAPPPTRSPRPTSTAGCRSADSTSRTSGIRSTRRCSPRTTPGSRRTQAVSSTRATAAGCTCSRRTPGFDNCPPACPAHTAYSRICQSAGKVTAAKTPVDQPPPFLGTWKRVYGVVLLYLVVLVTCSTG